MQKVIDGTPDVPGYVPKGWITEGKIQIKLEQDNFVASGYIDVPQRLRRFGESLLANTILRG